MNEDNWIKPKKFMRMNNFYKTYENKVYWYKINNKHVSLIDNDEIEYEDEEE